MFLETRMIISLISILILFLSFIASFKHQNATIFIVGLIVSVFINKCETVFPQMKKFFATKEQEEETRPFSKKPLTTIDENIMSVPEIKKEESFTIPEKTAPTMQATNKTKTTTTRQDIKMPEGMTYNKQHLRDMNDDASKPIPPEVAQRLVTNSILYSVNRNQQRAVYGHGRPLIHEVANGQRNLLAATPDFVTFGNVLVGNLRLNNEPTPDVYLKSKPKQNPELLKLKQAIPNPNLIPSSDYFPNCKSSGIGSNETIDDVDPRDKLRCRYPGIY
jgi:hypothetical protein